MKNEEANRYRAEVCIESDLHLNRRLVGIVQLENVLSTREKDSISKRDCSKTCFSAAGQLTKRWFTKRSHIRIVSGCARKYCSNFCGAGSSDKDKGMKSKTYAPSATIIFTVWNIKVKFRIELKKRVMKRKRTILTTVNIGKKKSLWKFISTLSATEREGKDFRARRPCQPSQKKEENQRRRELRIFILFY